VLDLFAEELTQFYDVAKNGPAPHPKFPAGWRPAPIVAQPNRIQDQKRTIWRAQVPRGNWHLIAKINGAWIPQRSFRRPADGDVAVEIPGAEAVEILVDRRPEK
jgi:hypothetical protein